MLRRPARRRARSRFDVEVPRAWAVVSRTRISPREPGDQDTARFTLGSWESSQQDRSGRRWMGVDTVLGATTTEVGVDSPSPPGFDEWVAARGPALLRLAHTLAGGGADAEDVVQDALSRALPRWDRISRVDDVDAYVRRMVVNAHTSRWRRFRRRETPVEQVHETPEAVVSSGTGLEHDEKDRIWQACRALPEAQRTAVVLRYYEQLDYAEIAALTGVREGSARSRVSRGLSALRVNLGAEMEGDDDA